MGKHLVHEVDRLKKMLLTLGTAVEEMVFHSLQAVKNRDEKLAEEVVERDHAIDTEEVAIEEECLKILALHQPVAVDLRYIVAALKMNNDLERIGDLAVNIAKRARDLSKLPPIAFPPDFDRITRKTQEMLRHSLEALIELDPKVARSVCADDDIVDTVHSEMFVYIQARIRENVGELEALILYLSVSRNLERIADHATNIAEDVIYLAEGEIVRHGGIGLS
jgi:phosphate transport system protein